jgi:hypothetical protein
MDLGHRSDQDLLSDITELVGSHRELTAKLIAYVGEIEERRLHLKMGFASMFEFCIKHLRMSEGEAFRRILAARLGRRFPVILSLLASGAVHLSALQLLGEHMTNENHAELLEAASGTSKLEIQQLLATRFPKPDVPSRIRRLPKRRGRAISAEPNTGLALDPPKQPVAERARVEPLSENRFKVQFTASAELREKLERARDLMSHVNPSRDLAVVVERAVDSLLVDLEKKKLGKTQRPRRTASKRNSESAHIKNAVRREVFERDGLRCTYVSPDGRRCEQRAFLELDHAEPRGRGGVDDASNLRVRCKAHNQLWAEQVYGREHVESRRRLRQEKSARARAGRQAPKLATGLPSISEKVRLALTGMGFRDAEAQRAIAEIENRHDPTQNPLDLEQMLRQALLVVDCGAAYRIAANTPSLPQGESVQP